MNNNNDFNNVGQNINNLNIIPQQPNNENNNSQMIPSTIQNNSEPNNNVILGTTSNITYMDTVGNITDNQPINTQNNLTSNVINNQLVSNEVVDNANYQNNTMINNLNIDGTYNGMQAPDYINDPVVKENITPNKKNTITITKELKTVIIIALVLLVFIIVMPILFDLLNNVRFH